MLLGDVAAIALSIIGFLLSLQGLWLLCRAMWPNRLRKTAECSRRWLRCFFVGLPVTGAAVFGAIFIGKGFGAVGQIVAWIFAGVFAFYAGVGTSGFVTLIGLRLASPADLDRPWRATVRGGVALELTCLIPIIGWLGILPASIILGAGAMTLSLFTSEPTRSHPPTGAFEESRSSPELQPVGALS
jgi:hypothetical protein